MKKKFQKDLNKKSPKIGYSLHSKFKWEAKSPGYRQLGNWSQAIASASLSRAKGKEIAKSEQS